MNDTEIKSEPNFFEKIKYEIDLITEKVGINGKYVIGGLILCSLFVLFGYFDYFLTNLVGIVYPAFCSIRAVESQEIDNDKQWLSYWIIFATMALFDFFSRIVKVFFPYYFFFKFVVIVWLIMPNFKGATIVYNRLISKLLILKDFLDKNYFNKTEEGKGKIDEGNLGGTDSGKLKKI